MATAAQGPAAPKGPTPQQINAAQRKQVLSQSVNMKQSIYTATFNPSNSNNIVNVNVRPVGLIKRFIVEVEATFAELGGAGTAAVTDFGPLNLLSNIQFTDLQNNQRHNAPGLQFGLTSAFKEREVYAGALDYAQAGANYGANWELVFATAPTADATGSARMVYEIPIAYSDDDLRGAIYANVVSNQMFLQLTVNSNTVPNTGDDTFAVFYGSASTATSSVTSITINVYQEYLDQLPVGPNGIVLPTLDVSTMYQLLFTNFTNIAAGQPFYIQYTSFRRFMSVLMIFNNTGTRGGRETGQDIINWQLLSANFTPIFLEDPLERARVARRILGTDPPPGTYYFPSRSHPVYTLTYGNMQLALTASTAATAAYIFAMWEFFGQQNTLSQAGSLPANG